MNGFFKKSNKGFTLVELVVVIVILAILIGVSVAGYSKYIGQSKINTDVQNAEIIRSAVVNAQAETGVYEVLKSMSSNAEAFKITVNNTGYTIEATDNAFKTAILEQLQVTSDTGTTFKTQTSECSFEVLAKIPATPNGSVVVTVTGTGAAYAGTSLGGGATS
jgi:prepilin-type N-terminal cleavage/methylation domain-containing protein